MSKEETDTASVADSHIPSVIKQDWVQKLIQKCNKAFESDETKKMLQVFIIDPMLNYVMSRLFPYIMIICVLFSILTILVGATLMVLFMRVPAVWKT